MPAKPTMLTNLSMRMGPGPNENRHEEIGRAIRACGGDAVWASGLKTPFFEQKDKMKS